MYCSLASVRCNKKSGSEMNTWFAWQHLRTLITFYGVGGLPEVTENIGKTISHDVGRLITEKSRLSYSRYWTGPSLLLTRGVLSNAKKETTRSSGNKWTKTCYQDYSVRLWCISSQKIFLVFLLISNFQNKCWFSYRHMEVLVK